MLGLYLVLKYHNSSLELKNKMPSLFNVSVAASIGLHATSLLACASSPMHGRRISERLGVSEAHLSKVLQRLVKTGLVRARRGPRGGFELKRPPEEITLREIYEAVEGPLDVSTCPFAVPLCAGGPCALGDRFRNAGGELLDFMGKALLSDYYQAFCIIGEQQPPEKA
jgi:Rrf2 family protein